MRATVDEDHRPRKSSGRRGRRDTLRGRHHDLPRFVRFRHIVTITIAVTVTVTAVFVVVVVRVETTPTLALAGDLVTC
jgi:hypothetical protein